jgi:hypothetical protein
MAISATVRDNASLNSVPLGWSRFRTSNPTTASQSHYQEKQQIGTAGLFGKTRGSPTVYYFKASGPPFPASHVTDVDAENGRPCDSWCTLNEAEAMLSHIRDTEP